MNLDGMLVATAASWVLIGWLNAASAQDPVPPGVDEMQLCHKGVREVERVYDGTDDKRIKDGLYRMIQEMYRAQDRDEAGLCRSLVTQAQKVIANIQAGG